MLREGGLNVKIIRSVGLDRKDIYGNKIEGDKWEETYSKDDIESVYELIKKVLYPGFESNDKHIYEGITNDIMWLSADDEFISLTDISGANFIDQVEKVNTYLAINEAFEKYLDLQSLCTETNKIVKGEVDYSITGIGISEKNMNKAIGYFENIENVEGFLNEIIQKYWEKSIEYEKTRKPEIRYQGKSYEFESLERYYGILAEMLEIELDKEMKCSEIKEKIFNAGVELKNNEKIFAFTGSVYNAYEGYISYKEENENQGLNYEQQRQGVTDKTGGIDKDGIDGKDEKGTDEMHA